MPNPQGMKQGRAGVSICASWSRKEAKIGVKVRGIVSVLVNLHITAGIPLQ